MRGRVLATVVALLAIGLPAQAAGWPRWAEEAAEGPYLESYGGADAVVVLDEWQIKLRGGSRTGIRRRLVHVLTEDGRADAAVTLTSGSFSRYRGVKLWVRQPDGRVQKFSDEDGTLFSASQQRVLDNTHVLKLAPPRVRPGSIVALEVRFERDAAIPQDLFEIQQDSPVVRSTITVDRRGGWETEARIFRGDTAQPTATEEEAAWTFENVPGAHSDRESFAPVAPRTTLALNYVAPGAESPFRDWASTARWVYELFGQRDPDGRQIDPGYDSVEEAVLEAGRRARSIRYFGVELGWGGYRPRPSETTLQRAFGDCKDKAVVMIDLLEEAGVQAVPVLLVAPSVAFVPEEIPSPFHFNHVGVGIPWRDRPREAGMVVIETPGLGPLRIFDATLSERSKQDLSPRHEGGTALVVHPGTTSISRLPGTAATENYRETRFEWRIDRQGYLSGSVLERRQGVMRMLLEGDAGEWIDQEELYDLVYATLFLQGLPPVELELGSITEDPDGSWVYDFEHKSRDALSSFGEIAMLELGTIFDHRDIPLPDENGAVEFLPFLGTRQESHDVTAEGRVLVGRPAGFEVSNSLGSVRLVVEDTESGVKIGREIAVTGLEVPYEKREEAAELRRAIREVNAARLLFEEAE